MEQKTAEKENRVKPTVDYRFEGGFWQNSFMIRKSINEIASSAKEAAKAEGEIGEKANESGPYYGAVSSADGSLRRMEVFGVQFSVPKKGRKGLKGLKGLKGRRARRSVQTGNARHLQRKIKEARTRTTTRTSRIVGRIRRREDAMARQVRRLPMGYGATSRGDRSVKLR